MYAFASFGGKPYMTVLMYAFSYICVNPYMRFVFAERLLEAYLQGGTIEHLQNLHKVLRPRYRRASYSHQLGK